MNLKFEIGFEIEILNLITLIPLTLSVLGVVIVCLFPLWPESVRDYSWYLSVAGAIFVGGILVLAICKRSSFELLSQIKSQMKFS